MGGNAKASTFLGKSRVPAGCAAMSRNPSSVGGGRGDQRGFMRCVVVKMILQFLSAAALDKAWNYLKCWSSGSSIGRRAVAEYTVCVQVNATGCGRTAVILASGPRFSWLKYSTCWKSLSEGCGLFLVCHESNAQTESQGTHRCLLNDPPSGRRHRPAPQPVPAFYLCKGLGMPPACKSHQRQM